MCISHSVMEGQRHSNTLNLRCLCLQRPKRDGAGSYLIHAIVEAAKALGGSFKLVSAKTVREVTQLPREHTKEWGIQTNQKAQMNTQSTNLG